MRGGLSPHRKTRELPFRDIVDFGRKQREVHDSFLRYVTSGRGRHLVSHDMFRLLLDRAALVDSPIQPLLRVAIAKEFNRILTVHAQQKHVLLVTLTPASAVLSPDQDPMAAIGQLRATVAAVLADFEYLGAIEPALFEAWNYDGSSQRRGYRVSWHVHAMIISDRPKNAKAIIKDRGKVLGAMYPGAEPVDVRSVAPAHVEGKLCYMLKLPRSGYRLVPKRAKVEADKPLSALLPETTKFGIRKHKLRPGERLLLYGAYPEVKMSDLWVASAAFQECLQDASRSVRLRISREIEAIDAAHEKSSSKSNGW